MYNSCCLVGPEGDSQLMDVCRNILKTCLSSLANGGVFQRRIILPGNCESRRTNSFSPFELRIHLLACGRQKFQGFQGFIAFPFAPSPIQITIFMGGMFTIKNKGGLWHCYTHIMRKWSGWHCHVMPFWDTHCIQPVECICKSRSITWKLWAWIWGSIIRGHRRELFKMRALSMDTWSTLSCWLCPGTGRKSLPHGPLIGDTNSFWMILMQYSVHLSFSGQQMSRN